MRNCVGVRQASNVPWGSDACWVRAGGSSCGAQSTGDADGLEIINRLYEESKIVNGVQKYKRRSKFRHLGCKRLLASQALWRLRYAVLGECGLSACVV